MEKNMILILTDDSDPHANYVERRLRERGADVFRFDPGQFPTNAHLSLTFSAGSTQAILHWRDEEFDLNRVQSIWYRRQRCYYAPFTGTGRGAYHYRWYG